MKVVMKLSMRGECSSDEEHFDSEGVGLELIVWLWSWYVEPS